MIGLSNFAVEAPQFKIPPDYRQKIVAWTKRYYVEPEAVRFFAIAEPVPILVTWGVPVWLVCVELDARETRWSLHGAEAHRIRL